MIRRPPRSTQSRSSAASDVYKRQAAQLGEVRLGFTQLAALYALADGGTTTIADLADTLNRSPSATSRLVDVLAHRRLLERRAAVSYTHLRAHETRHDLVCRLLLE